MNRRIISVLLALSVSTVAACGGGDEDSTQQTKLALSGVYRPVDQGAIGSVTFSGDKDYLLMPKGCGGGGCAEIGTYHLDTEGKVLVLENGTTHETRSIALEIVKTTPASGTLVKSVRPLDLVDPGEQLTRPGGGQIVQGGQQTTTGNGQQLATGGNQLAGAVSQLLQIVQQLMMNGQQMKRDDQAQQDMKQDPKADPKKDPKNDCGQGVPTKDTPLAEVAAYFARCPGGP